MLAPHRAEAPESDEDKMQLAVALARENVAHGGGPFGAVVFDGAHLVTGGVNLVLSSGFSIAHAEVVAILRMQQALRAEPGARVEDLPPLANRPSLTLVTSAEPCCQCFGAIVWSGIGRVICGANSADVEIIGFDEGPKPHDWSETLSKRGISVREGVEREAARGVLEEYRARGGVIYGRRR